MKRRLLIYDCDSGGVSVAVRALSRHLRAMHRQLEVAVWTRDCRHDSVVRPTDVVLLAPTYLSRSEYGKEQRLLHYQLCRMWRFLLAVRPRAVYVWAMDADEPSWELVPELIEFVLPCRMTSTPIDDTVTQLSPATTRFRGELPNASASHFGEWSAMIDLWAKRVGKPAQIASGVAQLSSIAASTERGRITVGHGQFSSPLKEDGIRISKAWLELMGSSQGRRPPSKRIWVIDDNIEKIRRTYIPQRLWAGSGYTFHYVPVEKILGRIDNLSAVSGEAAELPDAIILDLNLSCASGVDHAALSVLLARFPEQIRNQGLSWYGSIIAAKAKIQQLESELRQSGTDKADPRRARIAELIDSINEICVAAGVSNPDDLLGEFCGAAEHREGIVLYHYLKAFDELLPIVVLTAEENDVVKLRQTAGLATSFISKQALVKRPLSLREELDGLVEREGRQGCYAEARVLCQQVKKYAEQFAGVPAETDKWVEDTKTRVFAALVTEKANAAKGKAQRYFSRNFELASPTGSMCAERGAIAQALAGEMGIVRDNFRMLVVMGDPRNTKRTNPVAPCGVCSEWVRKLRKCHVVALSKDLNHFCFQPKDAKLAY